MSKAGCLRYQATRQTLELSDVELEGSLAGTLLRGMRRHRCVLLGSGYSGSRLARDNLLGGAAKEGLGEALEKRGGYASGSVRKC